MIDEWLATLQAGEILNEDNLYQLFDMLEEILIEEGNIQLVNAPVVVCGDIHGQFYDLLELFKIGGDIASHNYIFLGDFVDRGYNSVETWEYLLCMKIKYPHKITLLRGNHESRQITSVYGFYDEMNKKYGHANPWKRSVKLFDLLGLAAIIEGEIVCVHGGLSPELKTLDQIRVLRRDKEVPMEGPLCDLLWSDPEDSITSWDVSPRGAGWLFGQRATLEFNNINEMNFIIRSHQLAQDGYKYHFQTKQAITVWSAPNYCYRCGNLAAILSIEENMQRKIDLFASVTDASKIVPYRTIVPYFL